MAFHAYCKFADPSLKVKKGNVDLVPDKDLPKTGQPDGVDDKEQNPDYKSSAGWMRVIRFDYGVGANVEVSAGVSVGNVTKSECAILKYTGENTAVSYRAAFNRAPFDLELHITERLGQGKNKMNCKLIFRGCVFTEVQSSTGDPNNANFAGFGSSTSLEHKSSDTKELDMLKFVYQALDIDTFGKQTHCSTHGETK